MALFELNVYGNNDEILKTYQTDRVRWGVYLQATELSENLQKANATEKFKAISQFVKKIFPDLTDDDLDNADSDDVMNTFKQLINKANKIKGVEEGVEEGKNA